MNGALRYIEEHRAEYGVALFIIPVLLFSGAMSGFGCLVAWMLQ